MAEEFNPNEHTVDEVEKELANATPEKVAAIVQKEEAGKARKGVLESEQAEALVPEQFSEEQMSRTEPDGRVKYPWEV